MVKVGIIGYGNMGQAIAEGIKDKYTLCVFDKDKNKVAALKNITVANNPAGLVKQSEVIMLAVKPQDFDTLLNEIKSSVKSKLIISIAAGVTTLYIRSKLGEKTRVIRVMPNLPVKIGKGMICLCKGKHTYKKDLDFTKEIFDYMGKTVVINNEDMMDDVTAVSGSGPGFFYDYIEKQKIDYHHINPKIKKDFDYSLAKSLIDLKNKWPRDLALVLASATTAGSIALIKATGSTPLELKKQVTSKGGTTEAGLKVLRGKKENLSKAVKAAVKRAKELSKE
jgi:pyrroline-5-carboxylate reductase